MTVPIAPLGLTGDGPESRVSADELIELATGLLYTAFVLLMRYGLRRGQVLGLRWDDIDVEGGTIHIHQQLQPRMCGWQRSVGK